MPEIKLFRVDYMAPADRDNPKAKWATVQWPHTDIMIRFDEVSAQRCVDDLLVGGCKVQLLQLVNGGKPVTLSAWDKPRLWRSK
jgi:hypothetical protein